MTQFVDAIFGALLSMDPISIVKMLVMWAVGGVLIYLAIKKDMEPSLLLPMGFGAILVNLPLSGAIDQMRETGLEVGALDELFRAGISNELFPLLLFIGIGAMIDFGPLLTNPKLLLFGAAAQFGIFVTMTLACCVNAAVPGMFTLQDAASIGIIGAADGPTAIFVGNYFGTKYMGAIIVAAYSYMALVPIIQPPVIRAITTKKERMIRMPYESKNNQPHGADPLPHRGNGHRRRGRSPERLPGGLPDVRQPAAGCGVLNSLSETAQNVLANLITIFLGITIATKMQADQFLTWGTLLVIGLGLFAFVFDTVGGVMFAKLINLFSKKKINPMIGACGISAFPMSSRVIHKMGLKEDPQNFLLMHAAGVNVGGQIASVIAGGLILNLVAR